MPQEFEYQFEPERADFFEPDIPFPAEASYLPPPDTGANKELRGTLVEQRVEAILLDLPYVRDVQRTEHWSEEDTRDKIDLKVQLDEKSAPGRLAHVNIQVKSSRGGISYFENSLARRLRKSGDTRKPRQWLYDHHLAIVAAGDEHLKGNDIATMIPSSQVVYEIERQMDAMQRRDAEFSYSAAV